MRPLVGLHELEMHPEELQAEQVVVFGIDDLAEPDRYDGRVVPKAPDVDAVACDRIELEEIHHVLAGLAVDPVDRRFDRELAQMIAEILRRLVESDDRIIAAERQQHDSGAVAAERGVAFERAGQNLGAQERPRAVADQDDLLGVAVADHLAEIVGEAIDALIPFRPLPVRKLPGPDRVAQEIEQIGAVFAVFEKTAERRHEQRRRCENAEQMGDADRIEA